MLTGRSAPHLRFLAKMCGPFFNHEIHTVGISWSTKPRRGRNTLKMPPNLPRKGYLSRTATVCNGGHRFFSQDMNELSEERKQSGGEISLSALTAASRIYDRFSISHDQQISSPSSEASASLLTPPQDQQPSNRVQQHLAPDYAPRVHRFFFFSPPYCSLQSSSAMLFLHACTHARLPITFTSVEAFCCVVRG